MILYPVPPCSVVARHEIGEGHVALVETQLVGRAPDSDPRCASPPVDAEDHQGLTGLGPEGEAVLITQGSVAAGYFTTVKAPVDALIIGSIDEEG